MLSFIVGLILFIISSKITQNEYFEFILSVIGIVLMFEWSFDIHLTTILLSMVFMSVLLGMKKWSKLFQEEKKV